MTTPPILDEDAPRQRPLEDTQAGTNSIGVWLLRIASALVVPAVVVLFFFAFTFLKNEDTNKGVQVLVALIVGILGVWALYWGMDRLTNLLPAVAAHGVRPFVFAGPAMVLLGFYLVYPAVNTTIISFKDNRSTNWIGFDNYVRLFTESPYLISLRNSLVWVLVVPVLAVSVGLGFATMVDKLGRRTESVTKSLIFLPMAISFVGASVVWTFIYSFRPEGFGSQIGVLNGIWSALGGDPVNWLQSRPWNNLLLMVILVWLQTGFSMVILSSAIKGVPDVLLEAARIDGATEWQAFWRVVFPSIASTVVVVWTTVLITVWKVFDIVWVMTGGRDGTQVVAQQMVQEFFTNRNNGMGAALAVVLFVAVVPILVINVRRFRAQEAMR
ncbi:MAG TPA: sugar ABC transporter permease [Acidimicrobiia bacterium]|jgi:alpha-glucoside transport system permease protein